MYTDQTLAPEDAEWTLKTRKQIAAYLHKGPEGPFFLRTVDTVLSRDKNWVRWKIESCPAIERAPSSTAEYLSAKTAVKRGTTNKRLRPHPIASLDLGFLSYNNHYSVPGGAEEGGRITRLKRPRYPAPTLKDFARKIAEDELEIDMPDSEESKRHATELKASHSWRALRIARVTRKLALFDALDNPEKIGIVFEDGGKDKEELKDEEMVKEGEQESESKLDMENGKDEDGEGEGKVGSLDENTNDILTDAMEVSGP